ncbi:hypothetical protein M9458_010404, partial [Cirrhinus mrigala]
YSAILSSTGFGTEATDASSSQSANRSVLCFLAGGSSTAVTGSRMSLGYLPIP